MEPEDESDSEEVIEEEPYDYFQELNDEYYTQYSDEAPA